ncbi:protein SFI1 homolog isoform X2 [Nannospalax galili]|uniref:protein SFI1 homolog isoform X2 n=1 Tax=Nannospalax galili TaxID=1026970 RepID=UPI0004ED6F5E|nr:protein SFI1 homolog isoform X2 [Nannospalax galili]
MEKTDSRSLRDGVVKKPCTPKALPSKKSSAFPGIQRALPRSSHSVHYQSSPTLTPRRIRDLASQSLTKHRIRELRIRCVARKFLYLWIRITFGRVIPSRARLYCDQRILQKVFGEWREEWWISQKEWKLCIRADCHYRYYLYSLMFQNWKTFVHQRREMRSKFHRAEDHDTEQRLRQAWKSWLIYVVVRRTKLHMWTSALEFRQRSTLRLWWSRWKRQLEQVHMEHTCQAIAAKHRALSLQLQAWSRWQEQLLCSQRERRKAVAAMQHHQRWQKQSSMRAWLQYLHIRRVKRQENEMAARFRRVSVLQICFCDWQWAWEWRKSLSVHQALVEELAKRMALRRVFIHWKHYILLCAEEAAQHEAAEAHHQHSLMRSCFRALKDNVTQGRVWRVRRNLAQQQHDVTLLRRFWNLWQSSIEQREERVQLCSLHAAWSHYRVTVLHKCLRLWLQYMQRRRYKQLLRSRADGHFLQRALLLVFHTWCRLWRRHQQERVLHTRAVCFYRLTLEKQVFAIWRQKVFQHGENRLAERMAILQAERQLLWRSWFMWYQQAAANQQERKWQAMACAYHRLRLLRKAFCVWRASTQGFRTERMGSVRAVRFHSARLLHWAWSRWRECLALTAEEQEKLKHVDLHRQHVLLHRALQKWRIYQDRVRSILQEVAARESQHTRQLLRWVLHRWRENTMARLDEAKKNYQASVHYNRTLCSKVLVQWREVTSVQIYYRHREAATLREARKALDRGCLRNWFLHWQYRSQRAAQQRLQLEQAAKHHQQQLLLVGVARWKAHHLGCVRKKLLQKQGTQLLAQRLRQACFYQWRRQVWAAWLGFVLERRRKKERLEWAVQAHHQQLLQEGATRLLRFAAGMKVCRQQWQAQQQVQAAHSLNCVVRHCAELWKKKVLGPGKKSQPPAPIILSKRVTFEDSLLPEVAAEAGDATLETKKLRAPLSRGALGSLALAAGEPCLPEIDAAHSVRKQPRRPLFLLETWGSKRSLGCGTLREQGPEKPPERGQGMAQPGGLSLTRPFLPGALLNASGLKLPSIASPGLELLPPSSFMPHGAGAAARVSAQLTTLGSQPQAYPSLTRDSDPHVFLSKDFTSTKAGPEYGFEATGYTELEAELEGIQQQLQHYQTTRQNLWSCQRQANSLRRWLELSQEEPRYEDLDVEHQVQKELEEVELQIQQLAKELHAQRQPIGVSIARVQALRQALC